MNKVSAIEAVEYLRDRIVDELDTRWEYVKPSHRPNPYGEAQAEVFDTARNLVTVVIDDYLGRLREEG